MSNIDNILTEVEELNVDDQIKFLEEVKALVRKNQATKKKHSLLELRGLGAEIWANIDVEKYIEAERNW